jgi:predicted O-methyltransferase YrrM
MEIINRNITEYLLNITPERDRVLEEMEQVAFTKNFPIIGPLVGRFLFMTARMMKASRILELGSGYGYSAYWFAKGIGKKGEIICTDGNPDNAGKARAYFKQGKLTTKITFMVGDALKLIDTVDGKFDIIFNDVDKHQYPAVFRKAVPRLRKGGLLMSDNVLWSGKIIGKKPDAATAGILTYNRLINSSKELFTTIIPLRDGVSVSMKL